MKRNIGLSMKQRVFVVVALAYVLTMFAFVVPSHSATDFTIASNVVSQGAVFSGSGFLAGIENHATVPTTIGAQLFAPDGSKLGSYIATGRSGIAASVAFDGTNYLLIWEDDNNGLSNGTTGWQVYGQFISQAGAKVGSPFPVSSGGIWLDSVRPISFGGGKYLITYTKLINPAFGDSDTNRYIAGRLVASDGTMGSEFRISSGYGAACEVAFDGVNFFAVWREDQFDREVRGRFISMSGVPEWEFSIAAGTNAVDNPMSVTFDGVNYLVVWNENVITTANSWDTYGQLVSPAGRMVGSPIAITTEAGPQIATTAAFDGSRYLVVWIDAANDANGNGICDATEGTCWDLYGRFLGRNGLPDGDKFLISNAAGNQMGGVGFGNGRYLVLINNGVVRGPSGIVSVTDAVGRFITPSASRFVASGTFQFTYSGGVAGDPLAIIWTDSDFICSGPPLGNDSYTVTSLTAVTMVWADVGGDMTWTRVGAGSTGNIVGLWTMTNPGSGNTYTAQFNADGTASVSADVFSCDGSGGVPTITGFNPVSGMAGDLVEIYGSNTSALITGNRVMFNGVPAVITDVRPEVIYVLVPAGASSGPITFATANGSTASSTPFTVIPGIAASSLSWGGVHHRVDSYGAAFDALDVGTTSYSPSLLPGMSLTVNGPNGFSYNFTAADYRPNVHGQLAFYKKYPTPDTPLQPGVYTYTFNDGQGHISHRVDRHVSVTAPMPAVDSSTIQLQRMANNGNDSYRISWAPVNDTKTYYYRVRIMRNDATDTIIYSSPRDMAAFADLPAGVMFDDSVYKIRIDVSDSIANDLVTNHADSSWLLFMPRQSDYNVNRLLTNTATVYNRVNFGVAPSFDAVLAVSDPAKVTSILLTGPNDFSYAFNITPGNYCGMLPDISQGDYSCSTTNGTNRSTVFYKNFPNSLILSPGIYTFTYVANGITHTAYGTLTPAIANTPVSDSTMQAVENSDGVTVRFSWANTTGTGPMFYRVSIVGANQYVASYSTSRSGQAFIDIPKSVFVGNASLTGWRVELNDSDDASTQRNRIHSKTKSFATGPVIAYDNAAPVITNYRIRNIIKSTGTASIQLSAAVTSASTLSSIVVTGPIGFTRDLLAQGYYSPRLPGYFLEETGTLPAGLYTIVVTNSAGKSATRYMYVSAASLLQQPDFTTMQLDLLPDGTTGVAWAPVVADMPVWYTFRAYAGTDQDGDGLIDQVYSQLINGSITFQQTYIVIPTGAIMTPAVGQVSVSDGSSYSVITRSSQSVFVGPDGTPISDLFAADNTTIPLSVITTLPAANGVGAPAGSPGNSIAVTFNKPVDQRSLASGFTLGSSYGAVPVTVSYDPVMRTARFTPTAALLTGVTYTASIGTSVFDDWGTPLATGYTWSFTTEGSLPGLTVTIGGNGQVNGTFSCSTVQCSTIYPWGTMVSLSATESYGSVFANWSGACSGTDKALCSFSMDSDRAVTATFAKLDNIRVLNQLSVLQGSFDTLKHAYSDNVALSNGYVLELVRSAIFRFTETLVMDKSVQVIFKGGYDAAYTSNSGFTSAIKGPLKIKAGQLKAAGIAVIP